MVRLFSNVYQVLGREGSPLTSSVYLINTDEPILVDCGIRDKYPELKQNLSDLGISIAAIKMVIATHEHWDHTDAMVQIRKESSAKLALHKDGIVVVEKGDSDLTAAGPVYNKNASPLKVDIALHDGQILKVGNVSLQIIHTPGHTPASICILVELGGERILFAGDSIGGWFDSKSMSNREEWMTSLKKLLSYDFNFILEGHSPAVIFADVKTRIRDQLQCLEAGFLSWTAPMNAWSLTFRPPFA